MLELGVNSAKFGLLVMQRVPVGQQGLGVASVGRQPMEASATLATAAFPQQRMAASLVPMGRALGPAAATAAMAASAARTPMAEAAVVAMAQV